MRFLIVGPMLALILVLGAILTSCTETSPTTTGTTNTTATNSNAPAGSQAEADVPLAAKTVWSGTYSRDIQPIFDQYCVSCHGQGKAENGLRLDGYANVMRGTQYGAVVSPGSSGTSTLAAVIQGMADPKIKMPHDQRKLTRNRIQNILLWIEAGATEK